MFEYYSLLFIVIWFILAWLEKTIWISWLDFLLFGPNYEVSFHGIRIFPVCIVFWLDFANSNQKKISSNYIQNFGTIRLNSKQLPFTSNTYSNFNAHLYRFKAARLLFLTWSETYFALNVSTIALAVWSISFCAKPNRLIWKYNYIIIVLHVVQYISIE